MSKSVQFVTGSIDREWEGGTDGRILTNDHEGRCEGRNNHPRVEPFAMEGLAICQEGLQLGQGWMGPCGRRCARMCE